MPDQDDRPMLTSWSNGAKIPVRCVHQHFQLYAGQPLPELKDGGQYRLIVPAARFVNEKDRLLYTLKQSVPLLPPDKNIWFELNVPPEMIRSLSNSNPEEIREINRYYPYGVRAVLKDVLSLLIQGVYGGGLGRTDVDVPALGKEVASLNEAYSHLSQTFEPHRRSHTGNVFRKAWILRDDRDVSLEELRNETLEAVKAQFDAYYEEHRHNVAPPPFLFHPYWDW